MALDKHDRAAIRRVFRKVRADTDRLLASKMLASNQPLANKQMPNVIAAQNAMRSCMEVIFSECLPYDDVFLAELAVRLASYAVSCAPIERQEDMAAAVAASLPDAHRRRLKDGIAIRTVWEEGGVEHPNIPSREQVQ